MSRETAFEMTPSHIRVGPGVTWELGMELADRGVKRVLLLVDSNVAKFPAFASAIGSLERARIHFTLFDRVHVEPTDASFKEAIEVARTEPFEGFVAVGGGSTIDTAKAANLYSTYPAEFLDYVNPPIGEGKPCPGPLKPLIAVPTTAGTGSEATGVAIFDLVEMHAKTGIAHPRLKPTVGLIDPENTRTLPPEVAASCGLDVLSHAMESYTALPYSERAEPERPLLRPAYQGSNPISDLWAQQSLKMVAEFLLPAVKDPECDEARANMLLAAAYAGVGFGNAGVHLPHGMSYPVSGLVRDYHPPGYAVERPLVPHGMSVILNTPAVCRFTASGCPERHLRVAEILGAKVDRADVADSGKILADCIISLMKELNIPDGLSAVGYTKRDIPALVKGTLPQHRVTKLSPRPAGEEDLYRMFEDALSYY